MVRRERKRIPACALDAGVAQGQQGVNPPTPFLELWAQRLWLQRAAGCWHGGQPTFPSQQTLKNRNILTFPSTNLDILKTFTLF